MKAIVYSRNGKADTLKCGEVEKPAPGDGEVLIRVRAASVNPLDYHFLKHRRLRRFMAAMSKTSTTRPGVDAAGVVEAVGGNVTRFKPGDEVFGACDGAFAEYACGAESKLTAKPDGVSFEQAAAVPIAGITALQGLRDVGKVQPGQKVLINGAAGGVGTFSVQVGKWLAADVTAVCSTRNVEMVRGLGADRVIDYTREDFTESGEKYDVILDLVANHSFSARRRAMKPRGIYVGAGMVGTDVRVIPLLAGGIAETVRSLFVSQKFTSFVAKMKHEDLTAMADLMQSGKVRAVIDRSHTLEEVADAVRYIGEGHARGKVVIRLDN